MLSFKSCAITLAVATALGTVCGSAQTIKLRSAPRVDLPPVIDGNSAAFWSDGELSLFHSTGVPSISRGPNQFSLGPAQNVQFDAPEHSPVWFEAAWRDTDGTLFLWYHHEPGGICKGNGLTAPQIGAAVSYDGGATVRDLGIVLESGDAIDCNAKNGFFAGGHGDFSVILDRDRKYFYFFFTNYGGPLWEQGIAVARLAFEDRFQPAGAVHKYYAGDWFESGRGGRMTPVFPAAQPWQGSNTDSLWGPSIHWNTALEKYVILMNHTCCKPGWPQEGIYASWNSDLSQVDGWHKVTRVLAKSQISWSPGYYPQVLGLEADGTDTSAGALARLYVHGRSEWEILFDKADPVTVSVRPDACAELGTDYSNRAKIDSTSYASNDDGTCNPPLTQYPFTTIPLPTMKK